MNKAFIVIIALCFLYACHNTTFVQGKRYYTDLCASCHMEDGTGLVALIPSLQNSEYLKNEQAKLPCIIRKGIPDTSFVAMPAYKDLTAYEIANIINYINSSFGNNIGPQTINQIEARLTACD